MDKNRFALLFQEAIRRALQQAGISANFGESVVEFRGKPNPQQRVAVDEALDLLWLSADLFYRIVDVAAFVGEENPSVLFVRPSGLEPSAYADTWEPEGLGPFKVLGAMTRGRS
jgi:hypothetical protein